MRRERYHQKGILQGVGSMPAAEELKDVRMLVCDRQSRELIEFRDANGNVARFQRIS